MCKIKKIKIGAILLALSTCCSVGTSFGGCDIDNVFDGAFNGTSNITIGNGSNNACLTLKGNSNSYYTGTITVNNNATLSLQDNGSIVNAKVNLVGVSTFDTTNMVLPISIASLSSDGTFGSNVIIKTGDTLCLNNASGTYNGIINGTNVGFTISAGNETLGGVNTYAGNTTILLDATLILKGSISNSRVIVNGTLNVSGDVSNGDCSILSLSGSQDGEVILADGTLSLTNASGGAYSGSIDGPANLTIAGGVENLSDGHYNYTGATTINSNATLTLSGNGSISNSSSVNVNGTFDVSGSTNNTVCVSTLGGTDTAASIYLGNKKLVISPSGC